MENEQLTNPPGTLWKNLRIAAYILGTLFIFLFALDLMTSSLQHLGGNIAETILLATANPFNGLFIGLLITAMLQSSSTTTALVVALVASGSITVQSSIPIIMGANVGTTITSAIVSLGFIHKKKEFRRAVAAGTYHCFFNLLTVIILFPLEYYYGLLSSFSIRIAQYFFVPTVAPVESRIEHFWSGFSPVIDLLLKLIPNGFILIILSFVLLFGSILLFRKLISDLLKASSPEVFSRFFFKNQFKSFAWGLLTTAAIRSSTITTSVVVPIVAKRITTLKQAAPFIIGANIGTTITAFIAATLNANTAGGITIAIAHFLFNFIGMLIFFPVPLLRKLPIELASELGRLTLKYRLAGLVFLLATFFFIPFSLIYFNQDEIRTLNITYEVQNEREEKSYYRIVARTNVRTQNGEWERYNGADTESSKEPDLVYPVAVKNNTLFAGKDMYRFTKPGFCWDGEDTTGTYEACVDSVLATHTVGNIRFDSVYVCHVQYNSTKGPAPLYRIYLSAPYRIILRRESLTKDNKVIASEQVVSFRPQ